MRIEERRRRTWKENTKGFVFVTDYDDHGLFAYRDRPTLKKPFQIDALKRCCKSALSSH